MTKEEFLSLIDRHLKGNASEEDQKIIHNFFGAYENKSKYEELPEAADEMWESIQRQAFPTKDALQTDRHTAPPVTTGRPPIRSLGLRKLAVSLMLICAVTAGAALIYRYGSFGEPEWHTLTAPPQQKTVVTLPDHSVVQLHAGSSLTYPEAFASGNREVILTGEAFFEITKDATKPFVVRSGDVSTTVLGTSFNVQAFPNENTSVTVVTGRVQVSGKEGSSTAPVILTPGNQAVYDYRRQAITTSAVTVDQHISWRDNIISFHNTSLEEVAEKLGRWYGITLTFENDAVKHCRISGRYKEQRLEDVLESIEYMYNIRSKVNQKSVILYGKGCQ
jgi:transmembrane sensor